MKTPITIHISAVDRLYNDSMITDNEYKTIMERIATAKVAEKAGEKNG